MAEEPEVLDGDVEEAAAKVVGAGGPDPDLKPAVDDLLPVVVEDPTDLHEVLTRMDERDVQLLLEEVQTAALRKWVYELDGNKPGLSVHGVQDIVQRMNWTGKARIGLLVDSNGRPVMDIDRITADEGDGEEPFWQITAYAKDEVTGMVLPGVSMEPQRMKLRASTAKRKREQGQRIPEDNKIFDRFALTKAVQKATRNALGSFIPEEIEQTVIAMFVKDPSRVERIRTEAEQKLADMPPPLDDDEAKALIRQAEALYAEIRELGGGRGKIKLTPGTFNAWMLQSQHSHERLRGFITYLEERREQIPAELLREDQEREAVDTANKAACPRCEAPAGTFCKGVRGAHGERVRARLEEIRAVAS